MDILIVEDENVAATKLANMLKSLSPSYNIVKIAQSVKTTRQWLSTNRADLMFLDIQLSDGISFEIFEHMDIETPVIFTTAFDKYAIKAFDINSVSYLLKPIRMKDLEKALEKYHKLSDKHKVDTSTILELLNNNTNSYKKRFIVQSGEKIKKIDITDISYFYAEGKYTFFKTTNNKLYPSDFSLDKIEGMIDMENYFRINRKLIIHIDSIQEMTAWSRSRIKIKLTPPFHEPETPIVSVERSRAFKQWLDK